MDDKSLRDYNLNNIITVIMKNNVGSRAQRLLNDAIVRAKRRSMSSKFSLCHFPSGIVSAFA